MYMLIIKLIPHLNQSFNMFKHCLTEPVSIHIHTHYMLASSIHCLTEQQPDGKVVETILFHHVEYVYLVLSVEQVVCCQLTPLQTRLYKHLVKSNVAYRLQQTERKAGGVSASSLGFITNLKKLCNRKS